jgi:endonuclease G
MTSDGVGESDRPGYDPAFLGEGFVAPLPARTAALAGQLFEIDGDPELRYLTYSVFFHRTRRFPVLSAANFDQSKKGDIDRGDWWRGDPRVDADLTAVDALQVGGAWYDTRPRVPRKGTRNGVVIFDRGHLTSYENAHWSDDHRASRGRDTFHYTNCAPQWNQFNQHDLWRTLERWAGERGDGKVCLFNGCVFDAPRSAKAPDRRWKLQPQGPPHRDPCSGGIAVPKQFFKVVVWREDGKVRVESFIVTQEGWLVDLPALHRRSVADEELVDLPEELHVYRLDLGHVERLTGLSFDLPRHRMIEGESLPDPELITSLDDLN